MPQGASRRPLAAEARVRARVNPCGICGEQSCTGIGFPCLYHSAVARHTHISSWGINNKRPQFRDIVSLRRQEQQQAVVLADLVSLLTLTPFSCDLKDCSRYRSSKNVATFMYVNVAFICIARTVLLAPFQSWLYHNYLK
jgi:hypothetical protein